MTTCCILGLGYIGLPTAAVLAKAGHRVIGVDINPKVISTVNKGDIHIVEPNLAQVVANTVKEGLLSAQLHPSQADVFIIAVPTPFKKHTSIIPKPNVEFVMNAARAIAEVIKPGNLILLESTSPVGTTKKMAEVIYKVSGINKNSIKIAYCPERVLPGKILYELIHNDRVIGGIDSDSTIAGEEFYSTFCKGKILKTDASTAELVKLTENAYRDVNIAFANELSLICNHLEIEVRELIELANHHPRVNILQPGCGVGGHCIAVDPWFIASEVPSLTPLIQAARKVNDEKSSWVVEEVLARVDDLKKKLDRKPLVACLGLSYKPDIDDLRESPALQITTELIRKGLDVLTCEPNLTIHPTIKLSSLEEVIKNADLLVFLVAHTAFKNINLTNRDFIDLCGISQ